MAIVQIHQRPWWDTTDIDVFHQDGMLSTDRELAVKAPFYQIYSQQGFEIVQLDSWVQSLLREAAQFSYRRESDNYYTDRQSEVVQVAPARLNQLFGETLKPLFEAFSQQSLIFNNFYGPRRYLPGAFLRRHSDRPPLVISGSICIDQHLDAPWPIVIEKDGHYIEINLEPGELLLYEGYHLVHYRPVRLQGGFYTGIFVHYYPQSLAVETLPEGTDPGPSASTRHSPVPEPQPASALVTPRNAIDRLVFPPQVATDGSEAAMQYRYFSGLRQDLQAVQANLTLALQSVDQYLDRVNQASQENQAVPNRESLEVRQLKRELQQIFFRSTEQLIQINNRILQDRSEY